jgi:hypothetical protein
LQQALEQFRTSPRFDNLLALLLHFHLCLPLPVFDVPNFAAGVQAVRIQTLQLGGLHRRLSQHFPFVAAALACDILFFFPQRLQIFSHLLQLPFFEHGLANPPAAHAVQRELKPLHSLRIRPPGQFAQSSHGFFEGSLFLTVLF